MKLRIIKSYNSFIFVSTISVLHSKSRLQNEHESGVHLLRYGMRKLGFPEYDIHFSALGKPFFIENENAPFFSISHSNPYVVCAISETRIGCDIERIRRIPKILNNEINKIESLVYSPLSEDDVENDVQKWTIYESIGKCIGSGIPVPSEDINKDWNINSWFIDDTFILSTVSDPPNRPFCL